MNIPFDKLEATALAQGQADAMPDEAPELTPCETYLRAADWIKTITVDDKAPEGAAYIIGVVSYCCGYAHMSGYGKGLEEGYERASRPMTKFEEEQIGRIREIPVLEDPA